jgi:hypothetical protein
VSVYLPLHSFAPLFPQFTALIFLLFTLSIIPFPFANDFFAIFYCFPRPKTILPIFISFFSFYPKMHSTLQNGSSSMPIVGNSPFQHSSIQQANILAQSESPAAATGKAETTQNSDGNQLQVILTIRMLMQGKVDKRRGEIYIYFIIGSGQHYWQKGRLCETNSRTKWGKSEHFRWIMSRKVFL